MGTALVVITALVRRDHDPEEDYITLLEHAPGLDVEAALRAAVADYATTEPDDLRAVLQRTNCAFNWGDALAEIPAAIFARHGLRVQEDRLPVVTVEQNEQLLPDLE
jgi:hypothetical protein